jgi:cysteine-rich repeat protein
VRSAHQFITFATATPLQYAAVAAVDAGPDYYRELTADFRHKRDLLVGELARIGFDVTPPAGTYFACAGFGRFVDGPPDDLAFVRRLIDLGVAAIPPSVFYDHPEHGRSYVRFAFCKREETLRAAAGPECGDGSVDDGEACDDNNSRGRDGCSSACEIEAGFAQLAYAPAGGRPSASPSTLA